MDKALVLAQELKALRERVSNIIAIPTPLNGSDGLRGATGATGATGKQGATGETGKQGLQGVKGAQGLDGAVGVDGVSIVDAEVEIDGTLSFELSNGSFIKTTTEVTGEQGPRGVPGANGKSGSISGTALLDFGTGSTETEVIVTGVTQVSATSVIMATTRIEATANHLEDDLLVDPIRTAVKSLVVGNGFTIYGAMDNARANGLYKVDWFVSN